jgi:hypothetical protein
LLAGEAHLGEAEVRGENSRARLGVLKLGSERERNRFCCPCGSGTPRVFLARGRRPRRQHSANGCRCVLFEGLDSSRESRRGQREGRTSDWRRRAIYCVAKDVEAEEEVAGLGSPSVPITIARFGRRTNKSEYSGKKALLQLHGGSNRENTP